MSLKLDSLPTEIILANSRRSLGKIHLASMPQPGSHLELAGKTYAILERHHHYQYRIGGYQLHKISLYVQESRAIDEKSLHEGRWVVGDATCVYNARSEIMRCAVNPQGPCHECPHHESVNH